MKASRSTRVLHRSLGRVTLIRKRGIKAAWYLLRRRISFHVTSALPTRVWFLEARALRKRVDRGSATKSRGRSATRGLVRSLEDAPEIRTATSRFDSATDWHSDPNGYRYPLDRASSIKLFDDSHPGDARTVWEKNRFHDALELAYLLASSGDIQYRDQLGSLLRSWLRSNPPARGVNWTSAMEVAIRSINLVESSKLVPPDEGSNGLSDAIDLLLILHAQFIRRNLEISELGGNHLFSNYVGLYAIGSHFATSRYGQKLMRKARSRIVDELPRQIGPQGSPIEGSTRYHLLVTELAAYASAIARQSTEPFPEEVGASIESAISFLESWSAQTGEVIGIGDSDDGRIIRLFRASPSMLDLNDWNHRPTRNSPDIQSQRAALLFGGIDVRRGRRSKSSVCADWVHLANSRAHLWSRFQGRSLAGRGHAHADIGSFVFEIDGELVVVDPGHPRYGSPREERRRAIAFSNHNGLVLGHDPFQPLEYPLPSIGDIEAGVSAFQPGEQGGTVEGWHAGYREIGIGRAYRSFELNQSELIVRDKTFEPYQGEARLSLMIPGSEVSRMTGHEFTVLLHDNRELTLRVTSPQVVELTIESGQWFPRYGEAQSCSRLGIGFNNSGPVDFSMHLVFPDVDPVVDC